MTHSILNDLMLLRTSPIQDWFAYLKRINVNTFDEIFSGYSEGDKNTDSKIKNTIMFILCAFDESSPMVVARQDSKEEKENICELLDIPEYQRHALVYLSDAAIRKATTSYLIQFAGEQFRNLMFMRIQLMDFELMITNKEFVTEATDETKRPTYDSKDHLKCIQQKEILSRMIDKTEKEMAAKAKLAGLDIMREWKDKEVRTKKKGQRKGDPENLVRDNQQ